MTLKHILHFFLTIFLSLTGWQNIQILHGQGDLRIGEWSAHIPYNTGLTVTQSPTRIYYGTEFALLSILKSDSTQIEFFSKVDGLSDVTPSWIKYHHPLKMLIIGYVNGNIDLMD